MLEIEFFRSARVLPVIELDDANDSEALCEALMAGGMSAIELTLRTAAALPGLERMKKSFPDFAVGMGTITTPQQARDALSAGADFLVAPGATPALLEELKSCGARALPGVATASEGMRALEFGFDFVKFFPAEPAGGRAYLKSLAGPLPGLKFCPTGGIGAEAVNDYLALANVICVGGSWIAPRNLVRDGDWAAITANAQRATAK